GGPQIRQEGMHALLGRRGSCQRQSYWAISPIELDAVTELMLTKCKKHQIMPLIKTSEGGIFSSPKKEELAHWCIFCGAFRHITPDGWWTEWLLPATAKIGEEE
ncbi:MAG TPA: hypothetical protein VMX56_04365, partial [Anaerolineales bacterium]|nr:hypothetical protein [Anaerolineales bacterium]